MQYIIELIQFIQSATLNKPTETPKHCVSISNEQIALKNKEANVFDQSSFLYLAFLAIITSP